MNKFYLGIFIVSFLLLWTGKYELTKVGGHSMDPTLNDGQILLIDKYAEPEDKDIVILNTDGINNWDNHSSQIVKRYYEEYSTTGLYVLGDNPSVSYDSRYVGEIPKKCLLGVVVYKFQ